MLFDVQRMIAIYRIRFYFIVFVSILSSSFSFSMHSEKDFMLWQKMLIRGRLQIKDYSVYFQDISESQHALFET